MRLYCKELFTKKDKDNLIISLHLFIIFGFLFAFLGLIITIFFIISLWNNGYRLDLHSQINLQDLSSIGSFLAGTVGPIWALASILFFLETIVIQQKEIGEMKKNNVDQSISEVLYKHIELLDMQKISRIQIISTQEFNKMFIALALYYKNDLFKTLDLFIQTLPLEQKLKYFNQPLSINAITFSKQAYDDISGDNIETRNSILNESNEQLSLLQNITELISNISEEKQGVYFQLIKSKLGINGNIYLLLIMFYNNLSWNLCKFYTFSEVSDLFKEKKESQHDNAEFALFQSELLQRYIKNKTNT